MTNRNSYDTDVSDAEWDVIAPYLTLMTLDAPQRIYDLREVFNALRWQVQAGAPWRLVPHDLPPWYAVYQQAQRWFRAGVFATVVDDLRQWLRAATDRPLQPSAAIFDGRILQSTTESGARGLRWRQTPQGQQGPYGRGHPGPFVEPAGHGGQ